MLIALTGILCACGPGRGTTGGDDVECVMTPTPLDSLDAASITGQTPAYGHREGARRTLGHPS